MSVFHHRLHRAHSPTRRWGRALIVCAALLAMVVADVTTPPPAAAQDWNVQSGSERRQEIVRRYKTLLEKNPVEGMVFDRLVNYVGMGRGLERLIADYQKKVEANPDKLNLRLILGHLLKTSDDYDGALEQYEKAVEIDEASSVAWLSRGKAHMLLQNDQQANDDFEQALDLEKDRDRKKEILRKLADVAFGQRDWEGAQKYYDQLIELEPRNEYLRLEYAQVLVKYKRYEKAIEQYDELLRLAGRDTQKRATTLRDKGDVYEQMEEYDQAIATYRKAMGLMRAGHWLHNELRHRVVGVYRSADRLDELIAEYESKWSRPSYEQSMTLGELYDEIGRTDKALESFDRATRLNRRKSDPRLRIIRILQRRGEEKKVVQAYEDLVRVAPGEHQFRFDLVQLYFRIGERDKAEKQLAQIARRFRSNPQVYLQLADTYMRYDMREKAGKAYERLVRIDPRNESYILSLGEFYYRSGEMEEARKTWRRLLRTRLSAPEAHALLGETLTEYGQMDEGLQHYEKAVELAPEDLTIRRGIALAYARARRWEPAVSAWRHIMEHADRPEARAEARGRIIGVYQQQGRLSAMMRQYAETFESDAPSVEAGFFLAEAHIQRKEYDHAEKVYRKLLDLEGISEEEQLETYTALLRIYDRTNEHREAIAILETLAELRPQLAREYYHRIAELSLELYEDDKAVKYAMRAVEQNPDDATARARLAAIYREMQRLEAAAAEYRVAVDLDPRAWDHQMKLAEILLELNHFDDAEHRYRMVVSKADDESLILKAARKAIKLAESDGRLDELEAEFSPLLFSARSKPVYRKVMLELYDRMVTPLIAELRYGLTDDQQEAAQRLEVLSRRALPTLTDAVRSDDISQRSTAVRLLGDLKAGPAAPALARLALEPGSSLRGMAIGAVARIGDERASKILIGALDSDDPELRDLATWALGFTGGEAATNSLVDVLEDGQSWSQQALAAVSLGRIGGERAEAALDDALEKHAASGSSVDLEAVVWALGRLESQRSVDKLTTMLRQAPPELRGMAAWSLARVGSEQAVEALVDAYWSEDSSLRQTAARGLVRLAAGGQSQPNSAREVAHDLQFVDEHRHDMRVPAMISSLREESLAMQVGAEDGFISDQRTVIAGIAEGKLDTGSGRERRLVLRDLADMATGSAFGVLSPAGERDEEAVSEIVKALIEQLRELAASDDRRLLRPTATLLGVLGDARDSDRLGKLVEHDDPGVREAATSALGRMAAGAHVVETLQGLLTDDSFGVRAAAASSLGEVIAADDASAEQSTTLLAEALDDDFRAVREAAARGLVSLGSDEAITELSRRLPELATSVQLVALRALAASESPAAEKALAPFLEHADTRLRRAAAGY